MNYGFIVVQSVSMSGQVKMKTQSTAQNVMIIIGMNHTKKENMKSNPAEKQYIRFQFFVIAYLLGFNSF